MATNQPPADENPVTIGVEPVYFFIGVAAVPPAGTLPPPRPKGMERTPLPPGTVRGWEYIELEGTAVPAPPGTMPPPRPPGYPQRRLRAPQPQQSGAETAPAGVTGTRSVNEGAQVVSLIDAPVHPLTPKSEGELQQHPNPDSYLTDPVNLFGAVAEHVPPGTDASPRPEGQERVPETLPSAEVTALVARIESALETIHAALAEIKRLQAPPQSRPQSKAG